MYVDRAHSTDSTEEAWIAKYRTALNLAPQPQSGFPRVRSALKVLRHIVGSSFDKLLVMVRSQPLLKGAVRSIQRVPRLARRPSSTEVRPRSPLEL